MLETVLRAAGRDAVACGNVGYAGRRRGPRRATECSRSSCPASSCTGRRRCARPRAACSTSPRTTSTGTASMAAYAAAKARVLLGPVAVAGVDDPTAAGAARGRARAPPGRRHARRARPGPARRRRRRARRPRVRRRAPLADVADRPPRRAARADRRPRRSGARPRARRRRPRRSPRAWPRFRPGPHRDGAGRHASAGSRFVDDSKATNPHAAAASLAAQRPRRWCGSPAGCSRAPTSTSSSRGTPGGCGPRSLLGRDRAQIVAALARHAPDVPVVEVDRGRRWPVMWWMGVTVDPMPRGRPAAPPISPAPGTSSCSPRPRRRWTMFADYAQRGRAFADAVSALRRGARCERRRPPPRTSAGTARAGKPVTDERRAHVRGRGAGPAGAPRSGGPPSGCSSGCAAAHLAAPHPRRRSACSRCSGWSWCCPRRRSSPTPRAGRPTRCSADSCCSASRACSCSGSGLRAPARRSCARSPRRCWSVGVASLVAVLIAGDRPQRVARLVRPRPVLRAALRGRQARADACGARTCWPREQRSAPVAVRCSSPVVPVAVLLFTLLMLQPDLGMTVSLGVVLIALLCVRRRPAAADRRDRSGRPRRRRRAGRSPRATASRGSPRSSPVDGRPALGRLPGPAGAVLARRRRPVRCRARPGPGEVELPAQRAQRLHLRDHRRGARAGRGLRGARAVRDACLRRVPDRGARRRPVAGDRRRDLTTWLVAQAAINIGYVVGLLPVTGLQLPLISSGGTSLVVTMFVFGVLANAARHEPEAIAALRHQGPGRVVRLLGLRAPRPYRRGRAGAARGAPRTEAVEVRRWSSPAAAPPGTSNRRWRSPTPCAGCDPGARITALGTERGPGDHADPGRGLPAGADPRRCRCRASPAPTCCGCPAGSARPSRGSARCWTASAADVVVGFGGYVALPAYLARPRPRSRSWCTRRTRGAGLANKVGARFAARVAAAVPGSGLRGGARCSGIPLRRAITQLDRAALRAEARDALRAARDRADAAGVRRLAGRAHAQHGASRPPLPRAGRTPASRCCTPTAPNTRRSAGPAMPGYVPLPYLERMDLAYAAADAVLCRAGAMTVAEVSAVGLPAVYVPLPHGNGEQALNAAAGRRRRRWPARGRRRADRRAGARRRWSRCSADPARLAAMGAAAARIRARRRRRAARAGRARRRARAWRR